MVDITHKISSLRFARAQAIVKVSKQDTIAAIINRLVPKGDVFSMAKTAGLFAVKQTANLIPDCHPMPIEYTDIQFDTDGLSIKIIVEVATIYKTGVEVEAMTGASITALTIYDMLKPIDKNVSIENIALVEKKGGKSDFNVPPPNNFKAAVLVVSDSVSEQKSKDKAGEKILSKLKNLGVQNSEKNVVPDEKPAIEQAINDLYSQSTDLILTVGGTGLSPRDITPEVVSRMIDREIPGLMETARNYGQQRTPMAMLSRGIAGFKGKTLIITLPGSTKGATESFDALFPYLFHVFKVLNIDFKH
ncbi:MAG: bifunctional molybdenum cofactor biosynthesis protein MoaC/MoaB [Bacteroidetes bacterium]|nr:bifunctional molybdenum cofactor biosynthesis protein MoaC/MoaB [Bacteroidota bacterium]